MLQVFRVNNKDTRTTLSDVCKRQTFDELSLKHRSGGQCDGFDGFHGFDEFGEIDGFSGFKFLNMFSYQIDSKHHVGLTLTLLIAF